MPFKIFGLHVLGDPFVIRKFLAISAVSGAEYLIYLPMGSTTTVLLDKFGETRKPEIYLRSDSSVTVDLSATSETLKVEWFNPEQGTTTTGGTVTSGSVETFTAPFGGDAVLYIYQESSPPPAYNHVYLPGVLFSSKR